MEAPRVFSTDLDIRFRDLDAMGHVNNAVFFTYFEHGRIRFFREVFGIMDPSEFNIILAGISCNFLKPVSIRETLALHMWVSKIGRKSFTLKYHVANRDDEGIVYAAGESVQVWFDYPRNRTIEITADQNEKLSGYLHP